MVLRLTRALRTWWRFCSDECVMPQRHGVTRQGVVLTDLESLRDCQYNLSFSLALPLPLPLPLSGRVCRLREEHR